jgi:hypothetical protein
VIVEKKGFSSCRITPFPISSKFELLLFTFYFSNGLVGPFIDPSFGALIILPPLCMHITSITDTIEEFNILRLRSGRSFTAWRSRLSAG